MPKIPLEEYFEHLQGLDVEGKIKYLLDQAKETEKEKDRLESIIMAHIEQEHAALERNLDRLIKQVKAHISAHQAIMEAREAGK